ncbi:MAG: hypothetical protein WEB60_00755 [Terrimicrobiaceae bacterium]
MPFKEWTIPGDGITLIVRRNTIGGKVESFAVILVAFVDGSWINITRYDSAHGIPHRDILGKRKGLLEKEWFFGSSNLEVFEYAICDLQSHAQEYVRFFAN